MGDAISRIAGVSWVDLGNEQHKMGIRQPNSTNAVYRYLEDGIPIRPGCSYHHQYAMVNNACNPIIIKKLFLFIMIVAGMHGYRQARIQSCDKLSHSLFGNQNL